MTQPKTPDQSALAENRTKLANLRSHLANERTHLAYVRTSIALIGFGITLNRFSLYLHEKEVARTPELMGVLGLRATSKVGTGMAIVGLLLLAWALRRFWQVSRDIERGQFTPHFKPVVMMTLVLLTFGGASTLWLLIR